MDNPGLHCDRCGDRAWYLSLAPQTVGDECYWLCDECRLAIVAVWLVEHETLIKQCRAERADRSRAAGGR